MLASGRFDLFVIGKIKIIINSGRQLAQKLHELNIHFAGIFLQLGQEGLAGVLLQIIEAVGIIGDRQNRRNDIAFGNKAYVLFTRHVGEGINEIFDLAARHLISKARIGTR